MAMTSMGAAFPAGGAVEVLSLPLPPSSLGENLILDWTAVAPWRRLPCRRRGFGELGLVVGVCGEPVVVCWCSEVVLRVVLLFGGGPQ
jgi:hypothetical protein